MGCNGNTIKNEFINCNGIENIIIKLSEIDEQNYGRVIDFFDKACGLFDAPVNNHNKCTNIVTMLYRDYGIINDEMLYRIQFFIKMHKPCGIYLFLIMKEDVDD
jgi:hypothetical protein